MTTDEPGHLQAGVSYWQTREFDRSPVNPPLPKLMAALPIVLARPDVIYQRVNPYELRGYFDLLSLARLSGVCWSVLGGWLVFAWARDLYGEAAGCLAASLWCFEPSILGHAPLVTFDVPATVAGLAATYSFWRFLKVPTWRRACLAGLLLGVAQLTKFTLIVLYGSSLILWLLYVPSRRGERRSPTGPAAFDSLLHLLRHGEPRSPRGPAAFAAQTLLIIALSLIVLNMGYLFRGSGRALRSYSFSSRALETIQELTIDHLGDLPVPFPADYLYGMDTQKKGFEKGQPSYLAGRWKDRGGWWYYYLYAMSVKVPLGLWALVIWGLALSLRSRAVRAAWRDEVSLWLTAAVLLAVVSSQAGFSKHMRYALPAFPYAMIATGKLARLLPPRGPRQTRLLGTLWVWFVASSLTVYPHSLSYFNEVAGGPARGHAHLLDSNFDWGQDALFLKRWLEDHPSFRPLRLALYQVTDPRLLGIEYSLPPPGPGASPSAGDPGRVGPLPGHYAVSVSLLRGKLTSIANGSGARAYIGRHDQFSYFLRFRPIGRAGYTIHLYDISTTEANGVRKELGLPPVRPSD